MKDLINLLEYYLFDIVGIIIPGIAAIILYFLLTDSWNFVSVILSTPLIFNHSFIFGVLGVIFVYIIGTTIKVLSLILYKILGKCMPNELLKLLHRSLSYLKHERINRFFEYHYDGECCCERLIVSLLLCIVKILAQLVIGIFTGLIQIIIDIITFKFPYCMEELKPLYMSCREELNKIGISHIDETEDIEKSSHKIYKISSIIIREKGIKSLFENFLTKYNLFRSLAFEFFSATIISICLDKSSLTITFLGILWYVFHTKFQRYWNLCGEDSVASALVYLKTK